jgi:endonuclease/exonuclease/phosphatase (EEP) superfamily protein YafD
MGKIGRTWDRTLRVAVGGLAVATVAGFLGGWAWWLDLFAHFRVQYLATGLALAFAALLVRRRWAAVAAAALTAVNLAVVLPVVSGFPTLAASDGAGRLLKVITFNAFYRNADFAALAAFLRREDADLALLVEVPPAWKDAFDELASVYPHRLVKTVGVSRGIALLSKQPCVEARVLRDPAYGLPTVVCRFERDAGNFRVIGAHFAHPLLPAKALAQQSQIDVVRRLLADRADPTMVIGDLNMTVWSRSWHRLVEASGLEPAPGLVPTWPSALRPLGIAIDHVLATREIRIEKTWPGPDLGSDHRPLLAEVRIPR